MTLELNEREMKLIVDALRASEKFSKLGFRDRLYKELFKKPLADAVHRVARADAVFAEMVALRRKLGDEKPVEVES